MSLGQPVINWGYILVTFSDSVICKLKVIYSYNLLNILYIYMYNVFSIVKATMMAQ